MEIGRRAIILAVVAATSLPSVTKLWQVKMARYPAPPRTPWRSNFPAVIAHVDQRVMREHPAYQAAKNGESDDAALSLVYELISDKAIASLRTMIGEEQIRIVAVHAEEATGRNKIPLAYAEVLGHILGQTTDPGIIQSSVANHGGAPSIYHRMVSQPWFNGYIEAGAKYLVVDDTHTAGGTLANIKGFIETCGGIVLGMSTLATGRVDMPYYISLADTTLNRLNRTHSRLNDFWAGEFGYDLKCLTEGEAGHLLAAPTVDTIRNRLAEARRDLYLNGDEGSDCSTEPQAAPVHQQTDGAAAEASG